MTSIMAVRRALALGFFPSGSFSTITSRAWLATSFLSLRLSSSSKHNASVVNLHATKLLLPLVYAELLVFRTGLALILRLARRLDHTPKPNAILGDVGVTVVTVGRQ